jgi:hypothetical protein
MEEIVQGKLTEGEFSKFNALKARCFQQFLDSDAALTKNGESSSSLNDSGAPVMEDVSTPTDDGEGESGKSLSFPEAIPVVKVRMDSVSEAGYVIPKYEEASEFLV